MAPSGFTYPYDMGMVAHAPGALLLGPGAPTLRAARVFQQAPDVEQDLALTAPASGYYLLVVANLGNWTAAPFTLSVIVQRRAAGAGSFRPGDVTARTRKLLPVRRRGRGVDRGGAKVTATSSPRTRCAQPARPTANSIDLASDAGGPWRAGRDRHRRLRVASNTTFYSRRSAKPRGRSVGYEIQIASGFPALAPLSQIVSATLPASSQLVGTRSR